jgi:membrane-associated phospholipid phosphatase
MRILTDFADLAVLLPLTVCVAVGLAVLGWRRGALAWCAAIAAVMGTMVLLKLAFLGCGPVGAVSPSGHTAAGTVAYGGLAALWLRRRLGAPYAAVLASGAVAIVIGATRMALGLHTGFEVFLGGAVGVAGVAALLRMAGPAPARLYGRRLALVALPLILVLHGFRLPVEPRLRQAANWLPEALCGTQKTATLPVRPLPPPPNPA